MHLDGLLGGAELARDLLVQHAGYDQCKDLTLPGSELVGSTLDFSDRLVFLTLHPASSQGLIYRSKQ